MRSRWEIVHRISSTHQIATAIFGSAILSQVGQGLLRVFRLAVLPWWGSMLVAAILAGVLVWILTRRPNSKKLQVSPVAQPSKLNLVKAQMLVGQVAKVHDELVNLGKSYGHFAHPLGHDAVPHLGDKEHWTVPMLALDHFRARYSLLFDFVSSAALIIKDPVPPNDTHNLLGFPNEMDFDDVSQNLELYRRYLRAYIVTLENDIGKGSSS